MLSNKKGLAMLIVVGLIFMLLILGGTVLMVSTSHFGTSYHQIKRARAYYAAEAGMQHALWMCRTGNLPSGCDLETGCGGSWPITDSIPINDPNYTLTANIEIHPEGSDPLKSGTPAPPLIHPIVVEVNY